MNLYDYLGNALEFDVYGSLSYINGSGEDDSTEHINIYLPKNGRYVRYTFVHTVNASNNANVWRIGHADEVDNNFSLIRTLTTTGEWECALKIDGRSDFSGGYLHGDEVLTSISFIKDNKPVLDITSLIDEVKFNEFVIIQASNLYDPSNSSTVIAHHYSEHIFKSTGEVIINQTIKWLGTYTLEPSYLAMFPLSKTVSNKYYTNLDFTLSDIVLPISKTGVTDVHLIGSNVDSSFAVSKYPKNENETVLAILDNSGNPYNKCYYLASRTGDTVNNNDTWKSTTKYNFTFYD